MRRPASDIRMADRSFLSNKGDEGAKWLSRHQGTDLGYACPLIFVKR